MTLGHRPVGYAAGALRAGAGLAFAGLALRIAALVSCAPANSAGADGGVDASTATAGDQCSRIETALCMRFPDCAIPVASLSQCVADRNVTCCGTKCSAKSTTSEQSVSVCVAAIGQLDCNSVATEVTPTACQGIPASQ